MRFASAIVVALAGLVAAKGHSNNSTGTSTKSQCKQVAKLTKITELAANTTKLADKADNNATKIAEFQAKAATATTELATLSANATLMDSCNVIFAQEDMEDDCDEMAEIQKAMEIMNNATLLAKFTDNNATKAEKFKAKVAEKSADLSAMSSNTTLTAFCQAQNDKSACKSIAKLNKEQALAANTTALNAKYDSDADKVAKFQSKVAEKATKLATMMSNTTLLDTCSTLGITVAATTTNTTSDAASSSDSKSAAVSVKSLAGGQIFALVAAFIYALTML